ncbi:MAG: hypothetical protein H6739_37335 [Alphaproteobacteria bacterium]|nr:hypothetical protein [Alphaproteobacteria bacterium]
MPLLLALLVACSGAKPADDTAAPADDSAATADDTADTVDTRDTEVERWAIEWDEDCNPMAMADDCLTPYPSVWWTSDDPDSPTGLRLNLQNDDFNTPDGPLPVDLALFNEADGVSPVHPVLINLGVDVDPAWLSGWGDQAETVAPGAAIALLDAATGAPIPLLSEMDASNRDLPEYDGRRALILRPLAPMPYGGRVIAVLTQDITDVDGQAFESPPVFQALRDDILTDDPAVEALRPRYEQLFETLGDAGWAREDLLLAWEIPVVSETWARGPLLSMRAQAAPVAPEIAYTIDSVETDPNADVAWIVRGTFQPMSFLAEDNTLALDEAWAAIPQSDAPSYPFTMIIPPVARERGGLPLVLIGHGMFGTGDSMLTNGSGRDLLQPFANQLGVVMVATDWIGFSGGDLDLIVREILPDLSRVRVITDRLAQGQINAMSLVERVAAGLGDDPAIGRTQPDPLVDPEQVFYYGISLGGIEGSTQVAISPSISRAVLAVPGAGWTNMIQRSTQLRPLEAIIDALYPDPLSQSLFLAAIQGFFDRADPAVFAPLVVDDPDWPDAPDKVVVIQEAIGDCQVPNLATDTLSRAMGVHHLGEPTDPVYGLDQVDGPDLGPALTQVRVPELLDAYFPPDQNTMPETDNGVHNAAVLQPATYAQIEHLFTEGELIHPCEGACDPE